ncbi:MAG: hypothetical protein QOH43_256 [Solirubrobacteraceae bacterium]|jgi:hypothetical protein|nr:hypothetical protein [Solirubrobacteraceae bacterium]
MKRLVFTITVAAAGMIPLVLPGLAEAARLLR